MSLKFCAWETCADINMLTSTTLFNFICRSLFLIIYLTIVLMQALPVF